MFKGDLVLLEQAKFGGLLILFGRCMVVVLMKIVVFVVQDCFVSVLIYASFGCYGLGLAFVVAIDNFSSAGLC